MIPKFRVWMKSLKWMCDVTNISFDSKFVDICQQGDTERYTEMSVEFDEITLMQSTGLFERNGKEIFEGDIISDGHTSRDIRHHQTLGFYTIDGNGVEGFFGDTASLEDFEEVSKYISENIEIIGNIYENLELLEDKE